MRRLIVAVAVTALAMSGAVLVNPEPADAHGATVFPGSRQYFCWVDGLQADGSIVPENPACQDAVAQSGTTPLYNWFGNLHPSADGRTEGFIPDGRICDGGGGGPYDFSPYNQMRDDWPRTHLTAGDSYEFRHNNWAHHPGRFDVYLTEEGWDPDSPLSWEDLELIHSETDPPQSGTAGVEDNYYYWDITFPSDRSGQHLVFTHWVRSDSPENFYSCSDVVFDGGNGEVTGIGDDPPPPPPEECPDEAPTMPVDPAVSGMTTDSAQVTWGASDGCVTDYEVVDTSGADQNVLATVTGSPPATATGISGLEPDTSYTVAVRARNDNTGDVSALSAEVQFSTESDDDPPPPPPGQCEVDYSASNWGGHPGFTANVTVTNTGDAAIDGWELSWDYPAGQVVEEPGWSATVAQSGSTVTAVPADWTSTIAPGASVSFGFNGTAAEVGNNLPPEAFSLDDEPCEIAGG